jgi:hypothetical protein
METASVLAWFSGFDVPRDDIRNPWVAFEALPWEKTLRSALAGEEGSVQDAVDILVTGERQKQHKRKDGYSDGFVDVMMRMRVDRAFDVKTYLTNERVAKILGGDIPKFVGHGAEIAPLLSADMIRGLTVLAQDYLSAPRLMEVIQSIPDEMLEKAHADVRFLLSPYRAWVESSVSRMADGRITDVEYSALWLGPRLAWKTGRFLMQLDIALRRLGYGDEVDATMAMLRDVAARNETREVLSVLKRDWQALASSDGPGLGEDTWSALEQERMRDPAYDKAAEIFQYVGSALKDLWLSRLKLTLAEAAMEGIEDPAASTARHRSPR